jgi:hypothetical protein
MAESSKINGLHTPQLTQTGLTQTGLTQTGLTQRGMALSGGLALATAVGLAFAPILPLPSFWQMLKSQTAVSDSTWAGDLEPPGASTSATSRPLTSASYTTGFDTAAALPLPVASPVKLTVEDPNACPADLNCTFRPRLPAILPPPHPALAVAVASVPAPTRRIAAMLQPHQTPPAAAKQSAGPMPTDKNPTGLARWLPHLPAAHTLLKPFAFVANAMGGLIPKL